MEKVKIFIRFILKYSIYLYLTFCIIYTIHWATNREIDLCGIIVNKYSVPWIHRGGDVTYDNYISINGHEVKTSNNIFYKHNIGDNICIKYTSNVIGFHQIVGGLAVIVIFTLLLVKLFNFIFNPI